MLNNFIFIRCANKSLQIFDKIRDEIIIGDFNSFIFCNNLRYYPLDIDHIVTNICREFNPLPDYEIVKKDAEEIFSDFYKKGYLSRGETEEECIVKARRFSYSNNDIIQITSNTSTTDLVHFQNRCKRHPVLQSVMIEITKYCNERCIHCYIPHENKNIQMNSQSFYTILDQCKELGTIVDIKISGGECMSHPEFKKLIKYVKDKGFYLTILTNLTLLDDEIVTILKSGLQSEVQVSLFSLNKEIHDKITTINGSLDITLKNLDKLYNANIPVSLTTQVLELNKESITELYEFASKNKFKMLCDYIIIAKEDCNTENLKYRVNDLSIYSDICKMRIQKDKKYLESQLDAIKAPLKSKKSYLCNAGMNSVQIATELDVHACPGWSLKIGDLNNSLLKDIWSNSKELKKIRKIKLADFKKCVKCNNRNICNICMAQAYNECEKKYSMPNYACQVYNIVRKTMEDSLEINI